MTDPIPAASAPEKSSLIEDIVDVFYAPTPVFERRRASGYGVALLLYALLSAVMLYAARPVLRPVFDRQMDRAVEQMAENPNMSAEQRESAARTMRGMMDSPVALVFPIIFIPISIFLTGLALWVAGKLFGSTATYGQSTMVAVFAQFPRLVVTALVTGYMIVTGGEASNQYGLSLSPAAFLPADASTVTAALASRADVGVLWATALLGIGLAVVGKIPRGQAFIAAAIVWVLGGLFYVVSALREAA